ncbi:uncharacterized protein CELE_Y39A3A.3 [Caenorhabditis elegans]|uniref:Uncharacterized protein n=1 Tax=Caenorhabditis elegans TaxID=6239 RepID=Q9N521_CAEEL|nr:Uncharacterized protein CELE_Y39A3A.3 [Caenorhabditis elegans]CCD73006.2 Uncharacterized protein CELE_Y39A3A.3 [Caenorhabditis elegans]|eukprot:NP_497496.4 Uncharacterized protein CELE_Y39A3A.3 [Caenorhabditis elegans]
MSIQLFIIFFYFLVFPASTIFQFRQFPPAPVSDKGKNCPDGEFVYGIRVGNDGLEIFCRKFGTSSLSIEMDPLNTDGNIKYCSGSGVIVGLFRTENGDTHQLCEHTNDAWHGASCSRGFAVCGIKDKRDGGLQTFETFLKDFLECCKLPKVLNFQCKPEFSLNFAAERDNREGPNAVTDSFKLNISLTTSDGEDEMLTQEERSAVADSIIYSVQRYGLSETGTTYKMKNVTKILPLIKDAVMNPRQENSQYTIPAKTYTMVIQKVITCGNYQVSLPERFQKFTSN